MTSRIDYNNPCGNGGLDLAYHYELVSDLRRVHPFKKAIETVCPGKVVIESGTGTGILSILASRAGARHVYAIELDPHIAAFAKENIEKSGLARITLIQKNTREVKKSDINNDSADVVIAENLSTWQVTEPQIQVLNHINKHIAKPDAVRLPSMIYNYLELANSQYVFEDLIELRTHYFQFTGIQKPEIFSKRALFATINLNQINPTRFSHSVDVIATGDGIVNGLRLTSPLKVYQDIFFSSSDSLMPPVVVPLKNDLAVREGDPVRVHIEYETNTTWERFHCHIETVKCLKSSQEDQNET